MCYGYKIFNQNRKTLRIFRRNVANEKNTQKKMTLDAVHDALKLQSFYQKQDQFWQMLGFIRQTTNLKLSNIEHRQLARQLNLAIENAANFQTIQYSVENIYYIYFLVLGKLRGKKSVQNWMFEEKKETLTDLYKIYKLLFSLETPELPTFGKTNTEIKISQVNKK